MGLNHAVGKIVDDSIKEHEVGQDIERFADKSMYYAQPMEANEPRVHLLSMNSDPLGDIAAACMMYEGKVVYDLADITDEQRRGYWEQVQRTHLQAPMEFVRMHFLLEGVTRAFTHQLVRQRTAVYAQESLRFAVKEDLANEVALPPSIKPGSDQEEKWRVTVKNIQLAYDSLIANGVPAEDARGLLPHAVLTRVHYSTDLRNLLGHAGNRLCTQAQFEWRKVFLGIVKAIAGYAPSVARGIVSENDFHDNWQFQLIAHGPGFAPICYQLNKCPFKASFDRPCTIRDRVEENAAVGIDSSHWHQGHGDIPPIRTEEWMADERAAWAK